MLINAGGLYNSLYYIYKNKYNKKINTLDTENTAKLDYKKLRLTDWWLWVSAGRIKRKKHKKKE